MPIPAIVVGVIAAVPVVIKHAPKVMGVLGKIRDFLNSPEFQAVWQKFKACFSRSPAPAMLTLEALEAGHKKLRDELRNSYEQVLPNVAGDPEAFGERAMAQVNKVLANCMLGVINTKGSAVLEESFIKAREAAKREMDIYFKAEQAQKGQEAAIPAMSEVMLPDPNNPHGEVRRILVQQSAPPFENLVISASGAKGIGHAPALEALQNLGKIAEMKQVVGAAGGALTAISVASGMSAEKFQQVCDEIDTQEESHGHLLGFATKYPMVKMIANGGDEAGNSLRFMDQTSAFSVSSYLNDPWQGIEQKPTWKALSDGERGRLESLKKQNFDGDRTGQMITFGDLALLHKLDPEKFKLLVLAGHDASNQKTVYFSADTHPDMPVALAGRISISSPGSFQPVIYENQRYIGGGVVVKAPYEAITAGLSGAARQEASNKTLMLISDDSGHDYSIMHDDASEPDSVRVPFLDWLKSASPTSQKLHAEGLNVLPVYHGKAQASSPEEIDQVRTLSRLMAMEYIGNVMQNIRQDLVEDEQAVVRLMSDEAQDLFLQHRGSSSDPLDVSICNVIRASREARTLM